MNVMFELIFFFSFVFWIVSVVVVYQDTKKTGRSTFFWTLLVFLFPLIGLILYFYDMSRHPRQEEKDVEDLPSLQVAGRVIDGEENEKTVGMTVKSNDMTEAKRIFKESCAEDGLILTEEPEVNIKSTKKRYH